MKIQRVARWRAVCMATLFASVAAAQAPAGSARPTAPPGRAHEHGGKDKDHERGGKDHERGGKDHEHGGKDHEHDGKDHDHGGGRAGKQDQGKPGEDAANVNNPRRRAERSMRGLLDELKTGKLKKEDVRARLEKLREERGERQKEHRGELQQRWGMALNSPSAREELEHHARRSARLERALVLVETEVTKDRDKLRDRIQKLIDKEDARHVRAMERIKSEPGTVAGGAASAAAPSSSADKAGAK